MSASVEIATIECAHCQGCVDESAALRLFYGRCYCRVCVERESPALAEYVAAHDHLDDQITYDPKALLLEAVICAIPVAVTVLIMPPPVRLNSLAEFVVASLASLLATGVVFGLSFLVAQVRYPRVIAIERGQLSIYSPLRTRRYQLRDCEWRLERSGLRYVREGITLRARLLMIYVPGWRRRKAVAACQEDRSRELWTHFLRLSGVPEHR